MKDSDLLIYYGVCGMGLGHAARAVSIARRMWELSGGDRLRIMFSSYGEAAEVLEGEGLRCLREKPVVYGQNELGEVDVRLTIAEGPKNIYNFIRQVGDELYFQGVLKPTAVISDSRASTLIAARIRGTPAFLVINQLKVVIPVKRYSRAKVRAKSLAERVLLKILRYTWSYAGMIFVPDFPPPYTIASGNIPDKGEMQDNVVFAGPILPRWPEELPPRGRIRAEMGLGDVKLVVASFTGIRSEREYLSSRFIEEMKRYKEELERENVKVVVSLGDPERREIKETIGSNVVVRGWIEDKHYLLKAADLAVTHGGHTSVLESIVYGIPSLHIVNAGHTERIGNARSAEALGVAKMLTLGEECWRPGMIYRKLLECLNDSEMRANAAGISSKLSSFKGDFTVARRVLEHLGLL